MDEQKIVSFSFTKTKSSKELKENSALNDEAKAKREETDYVLALDHGTVKSTKPIEEKNKPLVVPLIPLNKWRLPKPEDLEKVDAPEEKSRSKYSNLIVKSSAGQDEVTSLAVKELLTEASGESKGQTDESLAIPLVKSLAMPLMMRNQVPAGYETDDKLDVSLRPEEAATADYDQVPIEQYGMALLRGMGFKEGQGIGKNNKTVAPIDAVVRPKGLGLGADRSLTLQKNNPQKSGTTGDEEKLVMKRGSHCCMVTGKHEGLYGQIEGVDEDNSRVVVKLAQGGSNVTVNQVVIRLVTSMDYDKNSRYINKAKVDKFKEAQEKNNDLNHSESSRHRKHEHSDERHRKSERGPDSDHNSHRSHRKHKTKHRDSSESHSDESSGEKSKHHKHRHSHKHSSSRRDRGDSDHVDRHRDSKSRHSHSDKRSRSNSPYCKQEDHDRKKKRSSRPASWLRPQIRVRLIDPDYLRGKYYKSKVVIEDVVSLDTCVCRSEDGKLLEGLSQAQLETVIPKSDKAHAMVVLGKHKGKVAEIFGRDKSACEVTAQVLPDREEVLRLSYDVICEYTGNVEDLEY